MKAQSSIIHYLQRATLTMRATATVVFITFSMLILMPTAVAAREEYKDYQQKAALEADDEGRMSQSLQEIDEHLKKLQATLAKGKPGTEEREVLKALHQDIEDRDSNVMANFAQIGQMLKDKQLPDIILKRHDDAVATYQKEYNTLVKNLKGLEQANDMKAARKACDIAVKHMSSKQHKRSHQPFDPNHLPFQPMQPNKHNTPKTTKKEYEAAGLFDNPPVKVAALGDFKFDQLPGASDPAFLAETVEVTLTQSIKDKAAELGNDPIKLYNFVRNNTEWLPTWGSMQDADLTLGSLRGNAFDIASLLIALYRASGIPSRYVQGTIDVPVDTFLNWAGGFTDINAAMDFASAGGIPITAVISGGKVTKVRMEHIWVEAAIDFEPSRGAINENADNWIQLDASYKQYNNIERINVETASSIDLEKTNNAYLGGIVSNEDESWSAGFDSLIVRQSQEQVFSDVEKYIGDNLTSPLVSDIIGGRINIIEELLLLPALLSNKTIVGVRYSKIPKLLQHSVKIAFSTQFGQLVDPIELPFAILNNQKISLSFSPAAIEDNEAILALLPDGDITDISQLSASIPSYLINVMPELSVNGNVIKTGTSTRLGNEIDFSYAIKFGDSPEQLTRSPVIAGSYLSVAMISGGVSLIKLQSLQNKLVNTQKKLESGNPIILQGLKNDDVIGDVYYEGILQYFSMYENYALIISQHQSYHMSLLTSAGTYGYEPRVNYLFGFPRSINTGGVFMDIDRVFISVGVEGNILERNSFVMQLGILSSALEHVVPEDIYSTPLNNKEAISAAKALLKANELGQRIYHITLGNMNMTLPNINQSKAVIDEIKLSINIGKEVIIHTNEVGITGWNGAGYVIFDPDTYAAAYKIGGGLNGAAIDTVEDNITKFVGAGLDIADLIKKVRDTSAIGQMKAALSALSKMTKLLIKFFVKNGVKAAEPCLTKTQGAALEAGVSNLSKLSFVSRGAKFVPSGAAVSLTVFLGQLIGYIFIFDLLINFVKINSAIGDCKIKQ